MSQSAYRFRDLVYSDLYRYYGRASGLLLLRVVLFGTCSKVGFWYRVCSSLRRKPVFWRPLYWLARLMARRVSIRFGIAIPAATEIGPGLFIGHFGQIFINSNVKIGRNCNLSQGVTIGRAGRAGRRGAPVVGNNVYIGPGAKIIGPVHIGNNVAIGANAVVTKDLPDGAVAVGVPAKVISRAGSGDFINNTEYESLLSSRRSDPCTG